jgi:hypothetical protein
MKITRRQLLLSGVAGAAGVSACMIPGLNDRREQDAITWELEFLVSEGRSVTVDVVMPRAIGKNKPLQAYWNGSPMWRSTEDHWTTFSGVSGTEQVKVSIRAGDKDGVLLINYLMYADGRGPWGMYELPVMRRCRWWGTFWPDEVYATPHADGFYGVVPSL